MGDTEKEADPVGGSGGADDGGLENRLGGRCLGEVTQEILQQLRAVLRNCRQKAF